MALMSLSLAADDGTMARRWRCDHVDGGVITSMAR
jgi:hypothetical protein